MATGRRKRPWPRRGGNPTPVRATPVPRMVPIGRPNANTQTYVLDAGHSRPVPVGVVGELYIGGVGVARGYRNRPDLTAERFIPDPFGGQRPALPNWGPGAPSARWRLEYLGRVDGQIKVRGFRVELGEIEAALRGVTGVRQAVVRAREEVPGETRLVAYVVLEPACSPSVGDLRQRLEADPPGAHGACELRLSRALPMTLSGKLDASALPAPEPARPELGSAYQEARTPVEEALTEIWMKVLRVGRVGSMTTSSSGWALLARDAGHIQNPRLASCRAAFAISLLESHHCGAGAGGCPETSRASGTGRDGAAFVRTGTASERKKWRWALTRSGIRDGRHNRTRCSSLSGSAGDLGASAQGEGSSGRGVHSAPRRGRPSSPVVRPAAALVL